jgi:molybdenum cofactor cytidylyltransferase
VAAQVSQGIRGILLCGGRASRFGSDKLLAPLHDHALVSHSARNLIAGAGNALAVIPTGAAALRRALEEAGCDILESSDTAGGLGASLAAGIAHLAQSAGWIIALGDMPFIEPATIAAVRAALERGAPIAAPILLTTRARGHPIGFSSAFRAELAALDGDEGARSVIERHRAAVTTIEVDDAGIVADIDRPADLEKHRR